MNTDSDNLATKARDEVLQGTFIAHMSPYFEGAKIMCRIDGNYVSDHLKDKIKERIYGEQTEEFLCSKYNWTDRIFSLIDWDAHKTAVGRIHILQQVTVHKFIHGWLATQKRRSREEGSTAPTCLLCADVDETNHVFRCRHVDMVRARSQGLRTVNNNLMTLLEKEACAAIMAGISSQETDQADVFCREFVLSNRTEIAMRQQEEIGWQHFIQGRLTKEWKYATLMDGTIVDQSMITGKVATAMLTYGLDSWRQRNKIIHGNDGAVSTLEKFKIAETITEIYDKLLPEIHPTHAWLFSMKKEEKLTESYAVQIAWLDSVCKLYPEKYTKIRPGPGRALASRDEVERQKMHRAGVSE